MRRLAVENTRFKLDEIRFPIVSELLRRYWSKASPPVNAYGQARKNGVCVLLCALMIGTCSLTVDAQTGNTNRSRYSFSNLGETSAGTSSSGGPLNIGYGEIKPDAGITNPSARALLGFKSGCCATTLFTIPATLPVSSGRIYAEVKDSATTVIAIANTSTAPIAISFYFTDAATSMDFGQGSFTLAARNQITAFLDQVSFLPPNFTGSLTFSASAPVGVAALRRFINERGDSLFTGQAVAPINQAVNGPLVIAQFVDGGGWRTSLDLLNSTDQSITGIVKFYNEGGSSAAGAPIAMTVNGQSGKSFPYTIPAHSSARMSSAGLGAATEMGSLIITPAEGSASPSAQALFSFNKDGITITEAPVAAEPAGTAFRMFVHVNRTVGEPSFAASALGITNMDTSPASVDIEVFRQNGSSTGLQASIMIPALGHITKLITDIFPSLRGSAFGPFLGVARITSASSPIAVAGMLAGYNERFDFLLTANPASNEAGVSSTGGLIFPIVAYQGAERGGFSVEYDLFSGLPGQTGSGLISFFKQNGQPLNVFSVGP